MSQKVVNVQGHNFQGPYSLALTSFNEVPGIYLITKDDGMVVDVGETENLKNRMANHERSSCWERNNAYNLWFHVENNSMGRLVKEKLLRLNFNPVCGIR